MHAAAVVVPAMLAGMLLHDRWFAVSPKAAAPVLPGAGEVGRDG
jgi:hypothetical protein